MPLHPQVAEFMRIVESWGRPPRHTLTPQENREGSHRLIPYMGDPAPVAEVKDISIPRRDRAAPKEGAVPVRVYRPEHSSDPLPVLVYFHGGGWVIGDLEIADRPCRSLAALAECVVVSVDYRLAPEHPFPAGLEDCCTVVEELAKHSDEYGIDPARLAVGGDSAGGNLATAVCQLARGDGPEIRHQLLIVPVTDCDLDRESYREFADGPYLTRADMAYYFQHYVGDSDRTDPRIAPLRSADLSGLPPATVITAECDVLRDEGDAYAGALAESGVAVEHRRFDGMFHPFFQMAGIIDGGREAQQHAAARLRDAFEGQP